MTFAERLRASRNAKKEPEQGNVLKEKIKGKNEAYKAEKEVNKKETAEEIIARIKGDLNKLEEIIRSEQQWQN